MSVEFEQDLQNGDARKAYFTPNVDLNLEYPRLGTRTISTFLEAFPELYYHKKLLGEMIRDYQPGYYVYLNQAVYERSYPLTEFLSRVLRQNPRPEYQDLITF
jgi:hypothetical protein